MRACQIAIKKIFIFEHFREEMLLFKGITLKDYNLGRSSREKYLSIETKKFQKDHMQIVLKLF